MTDPNQAPARPSEGADVLAVESAIALAFDGRQWSEQPSIWQQHFRKMARAAIAVIERRAADHGAAPVGSEAPRAAAGELDQWKQRALDAERLVATHDLDYELSSAKLIAISLDANYKMACNERDDWKQRAERAEAKLAEAERMLEVRKAMLDEAVTELGRFVAAYPRPR